MSHGHHGPPKEPIGWMDRPEAVKRFFTIFYVVCALVIVGELVFGVATDHPHPLEEAWPLFFYPVYGFVSFWFLVLVARPMRTLLIRSEDYYEGGGKYVEAGGDGGATDRTSVPGRAGEASPDHADDGGAHG